MGAILTAVLWFLAIGTVLGVALSFAAKFFAVEEDPRIEKITELLPSANCGGCGKAGCAALAEAIVKGEAKPSDCSVVDEENLKKISEIAGVEAGSQVKMRAVVMCSGTHDFAKKKYTYDGVEDCVAAAALAGGDKLCPNGCVGLGSCVRACKLNAIKIINGCAAVDPNLCHGCGTCVQACPKNIVKLIPADAKYWVGCTCVESGAVTRRACEVGCIGCKICEKNCPSDAIHIENGLAKIDYHKCTACGKCADSCPRHIIWCADGKISVKETESAQTV